VSPCCDKNIVSDNVNTGPYPEAVEQYTESIKLNPNDAKVGYGTPRLCNQASSPLDAHHIMTLCLAHIVELHIMLRRPCHAAYSNRAACHTHLGAFSAAIADAEKCIALEPAWGKGYWRKGHVALITEQYAMARPNVGWSTLAT
jgi:hypothetical protein